MTTILSGMTPLRLLLQGLGFRAPGDAAVVANWNYTRVRCVSEARGEVSHNKAVARLVLCTV